MRYVKYGHGKWQQNECNKLIMKPAGLDIGDFTHQLIKQIMEVLLYQQRLFVLTRGGETSWIKLEKTVYFLQ